MSELFGNTTGFTPAFTGQQLSIEAGKGLAQSFTSGMNAGSNSRQTGVAEDEFQLEKDKYNDTARRLDAFRSWLNE